MLSPLYDPDRYSNRRLRAQLQQTKVLRQEDWKSKLVPVEMPLFPQQQPLPEQAQGESWLKRFLPAPPNLAWKQVPTGGWNKLDPPKIYPWNKVGYQDQISGPPPAQPKSFADAVERSRTDCKTCQVAQPDLVSLGCSIATGDGEDLSVTGRQLANHYRPYPGFNTPPIGQSQVMVTEPNRNTKQGDNFNITPLFTHYDANLYKTPYDRSENMVSTGIMTNPWTGSTFETFEKQLPPPTTSKYVIDKDQLKRTNPILVWLNGGIDPNAPLPSKREVCQDIPGPDGGPNVWGTQLYAEQIGQRIKQTVESQVWNNRNGIYSTETSFPKEQPAGYVGLQPVLRAIPYLPPTQRSSMDIKGWVGPVSDTFNLGNNPVEQHGIVETRKVDLNSGGCMRFGGAAGFGGQEAEPVMPVVDPRPTWRGRTDGWVSGAAQVDETGGHVVTDVTVRDTLKGLNEEQFPILSALVPTEQFGGHVVTDVTVRDTLKGLNEQQFPLFSALTPTEQFGGHVVTDVTVRDTLKGLNEQQFPQFSALTPTEQFGGYVVTDVTVRDTLKGLNESQFPITSMSVLENMPSTGLSVIDPTVRDTLKGLNESQFPITSTTPLESMPSTGLSVIDPTLRDTLKGLNERQFPITSTTPLESMPSTGLSVIDPTVRDTLKGLSELALPVRMAALENGQESGYVVIDTVPRETLKGLNEMQLQTGMASEDATGSWIPFQGDMRIGPRREYYSTQNPLVSAAFLPSLSGPNIGPAMTTSRQNRGQDELYWTEPSQIHVEGGEAMTRWIGMQTRDTRREMGPAIPVANFTQDNGVNLSVPRQYPLVFPSCQRPDDIDDEFLNIRPTWFGESVSA